MNVLFLTMNTFYSIDMHNIYSDLMKVFIAHGHRPYIVTPREKRLGEETELCNYDDYSLLKVKIGNSKNVSFIEKGISTLLLERQYYHAIDKFLGDIHFDIILYSTPPITLAGVVKRMKQKCKAKTYLMLKDIFPQNAIDLGLFSPKSPIAWYFRRKEKKLYRLSDKIGCMSPANVEFVLKHNPELPKEKVEILPNAIIPNALGNRQSAKAAVRSQYNIPDEAITLLFGGNLGKPQGIPYLVDCLKSVKNRNDFFFVVCGTGGDYPLIKKYVTEEKPTNVLLINGLPKKEYDLLASGCDVGLILLDYRFTIPNFPSRILSYMENATPVICATDPNTDVGKMVEDNEIGFACHSNSVSAFVGCLEKIKAADRTTMGTKARVLCSTLYSVEECYSTIVESCK